MKEISTLNMSGSLLDVLSHLWAIFSLINLKVVGIIIIIHISKIEN